MANEQTAEYDDLRSQLRLEASRADRLERELGGIHKLKEELREIRSEVIALKQYMLFSADRNNATKPNLSWECFARQAELLSVKVLARVIHGGDLKASVSHHRRASSPYTNTPYIASRLRDQFPRLPPTGHWSHTSLKKKTAADIADGPPRASPELKHQLASWSSPPCPVKRARTIHERLIRGRPEANKDSPSENSEASTTSMSSSEDDADTPRRRPRPIAKPTSIPRKSDGRRTSEQAKEKPELMLPSQSTPLESLRGRIGKVPSNITPSPQNRSRQ
ncbi:hypothetical protein DL765_003528 [Monosporascus sp. GIB2]|nr:hypothetical protein DL765_003528 [Monosporascus sp. GIB2]